jgi:hypothetical protein
VLALDCGFSDWLRAERAGAGINILLHRLDSAAFSAKNHHQQTSYYRDTSNGREILSFGHQPKIVDAPQT